jgi:hypothetical protein
MPYYNSISMIGGFLGPYLTGYLLARPSGIHILCIILGAILIAAAGAIMLLRHMFHRRERHEQAASADDSDSADATVETAGIGAKDIEAPGLPGAVAKESGPDLGVQLVNTKQGDVLRRKQRDVTRDLLPPRG